MPTITMKKTASPALTLPAPYTALEIAQWFLWRNHIEEGDSGGEPMSLLKLAKLVYYAEGCSLAMERGSLFDEPILAWSYGPMIQSIWDEYQETEDAIPYDAEEIKATIANIAEEDQKLLDDVFETFGQYAAWKLYEMTTEEIPWLAATKGMHELGGEISRAEMKRQIKQDYITD